MGDAAEKLDDLGTGSVRRELKTIATIDARLQRWAQHSRAGVLQVAGGIGGNPIAAAIENGGVVARGTAPASSMPDDVYDTDRAVTKLPAELNQVVREHYLHADATETTRVANCECSRKTYFRRLAKAHHAVLFLLQSPAKVRGRQRR